MASVRPSSKPQKGKQPLEVLILGSEMYFNRTVSLVIVCILLHALRNTTVGGTQSFPRLPQGPMAQRCSRTPDQPGQSCSRPLGCSPSFTPLMISSQQFPFSQVFKMNKKQPYFLFISQYCNSFKNTLAKHQVSQIL